MVPREKGEKKEGKEMMNSEERESELPATMGRWAPTSCLPFDFWNDRCDIKHVCVWCFLVLFTPILMHVPKKSTKLTV